MRDAPPPSPPSVVGAEHQPGVELLLKEVLVLLTEQRRAARGRPAGRRGLPVHVVLTGVSALAALVQAVVSVLRVAG